MESQGDPFICPFCTTVPCLLPFSASNVPNFTWGSTVITGPAFCEKIHQAYESSVHWKHNLFLVPYGSAGSHFVTELAKLYESFGSASAMECIALEASMVLPALLLQKPHIRSKSRENMNAICISGMRVILMLCLSKATLSSDIYNILITPLQLTALAYLLAWSSKERLKLPCGSSRNSLGAHSCLSPLQWGVYCV